MKLEWNYLISSVLQGAEQYISELPYPHTYSESNSLQYINQMINHPDSAVLVHVEQDKAVGACVVNRSRDFWEEYSGNILHFYVIPEYRKTGVGRSIIKEAVQWFDEHECNVSFAGAHAGIGQDKLFVNLLSKFGYESRGSLLIRKGNKQ